MVGQGAATPDQTGELRGRTVDAVLQARMRSRRMTGKVLAPVLGRPLLSLLLERLRRCRTVGRLVVATTVDPADDAIAALCGAERVPVFRGDDEDVLDRLYQCGRRYGMRALARFTGDNPLIDPAVADRVIGFYLAHEDAYDYVSNNHPPTWPDGFEVEVVSLEALERAWREADKPFQREHATPYIWDQPGLFRVGNVALPDDRLYRETRWTIDHPEDYAFVRRIFEELYPGTPAFGMEDVLALLRRCPEIRALNAHLGSDIWYQHHLDDLRTVSPDALRKEGA